MGSYSTLLIRAKRFATFLGFGGRVGRLAFFGWCMSLGMCTLVLLAAASFAARLVPVHVAAMLVAVPVVWAALVLVVRRLHDFKCSGLNALWITALHIAPGWVDGTVGTAVTVCKHGVVAWLSLMPGSPGPNRFGAAPAPIPAPANTGGAGDQSQNSSRG